LIEAIKMGRSIRINVASADAYFASLPKAVIKPDRRSVAATIPAAA